ncbi:TRAP transporter substrate-binding protein [Paracoccus sp. FO-3]|uniref:TRAP transporter substrate-binding protein n=1 Tax=Paracoccus sp. FO-3 TaxID=1335059 RepID=UPI0009149D5F|nr:TRAP transporter substrate-binding protein [Paracoccus sp. FO-3]SFX67730.1 tripartite ATP-independent transporter solute receptor, DctP family [Paracoccus pantotrophus]
MTITTRRSLLKGAGVVAAGAALSFPMPWTARAASSVKLRFGHPHPDSDSWQEVALWMAETVKDKTGGAITIEVFANGILGSDQTMINAVRGGSIDMMITGNPFFTGLAPQLNVLDLPYLFKDRDHVAAVLDGELGDELRAGLEASDLKALATWETGWRNVTNSRRPVHLPEDLKGLKLRTTPNQAHIRAFELLGAVPTPMAFTELFTALEMRSIDGQENPTTLILNSNFYEVQQHISLTQHAFTSSPLVMTKATFDKLAPEHQAVLLETAREGARKQRQMNADREATSLAALKDHGMEAVEDIDREAFRAIVADTVLAEFVEKFGAELPGRIAALAA